MEPDELATMGESVRMLGMAAGCLLIATLWCLAMIGIMVAVAWL